MGQCQAPGCQVSERADALEFQPSHNTSSSRVAIPDGESFPPDIVNAMLKVVWPSIENFGRDMLEKAIEPAIKRALPATLGEAFSINTKEFSLGDQPMDFGPMTMSQGVQHTADDIDIKVLIIRTSLRWEGDISAYVAISGMKCGVTKVSLSGDLLLEMVGTCPNPPFFQGARGCFVNPPAIHLSYDAAMFSRLTNFKPIDAKIHDVLSEKLAEKLVVPNRQGVRLDPTCEMFRILKPRPAGMLSVTFSHATGLQGKDVRLIGKKTSDPHLIVRCGCMTFESAVVNGTTEPKFDWTILLPVDLPNDQLLNIQVLDKDVLGVDFLGQIPAKPVKELIETAGKTIELSLLDETGKAGKNGTLFITAQWRRLLLPKENPSLDSMLSSRYAVVFVGIYKARRIPYDEITADDVYWTEIQCDRRLGLGGSDTSKPRSSPKKVADPVVAPEHDTEEEKKLFQEKKALCTKYNMAPADMAKLLDVDPRALADIKEGAVASVRHNEVVWNYAVDFFVTDLKEGTLELKLMKSEKGTTQSVAGRAQSFMAGGSLTMGSWTMKVTDLIRENKPMMVFKCDDSNITVHTRIQVRCVSDPIPGSA
mmetsp:Transcript_29810/g.64516  ORF Transcript_29810/g.64516 Transcript_29810/m.64516 type:complete len:593 (-) Transcript_29810:318-2096(-)